MREALISDYLFFQEGPGVRNNQYTSEGVKLLNVSNLVDGKLDLSNSNRYISSDEAYGKYKHFLCDDGDLIIASSGIKVDYFDKKIGFIKKEMLPLCMNTSTIRFKTLDDKLLNINYFYHYLKSEHFKKQLNRNITGSAQLNFGPSHLKKMKFIICDINEQNKITKKLAAVDKAIELKKMELIKLDELIKSQFVEMFEGKDFEKKTLQEITTKITDGSHNPPSGIAENLGYLMLSSQNIINDKINYENARYLSKEDFEKENMRTDLKNGDILLTIVGTVGRTAIIKNEKNITLQRSVAVLKPIKEINSDYLVDALKSDDFVKQLNKGVKGVAQKGIYLNDLKKLTVLVPPIDLQNKFAKFVEQADKQKFVVMKILSYVSKIRYL